MNFTRADQVIALKMFLETGKISLILEDLAHICEGWKYFALEQKDNRLASYWESIQVSLEVASELVRTQEDGKQSSSN